MGPWTCEPHTGEQEGPGTRDRPGREEAYGGEAAVRPAGSSFRWLIMEMAVGSSPGTSATILAKGPPSWGPGAQTSVAWGVGLTGWGNGSLCWLPCLTAGLH